MKKLFFAIIASLAFLVSCNKDEDSTSVVGDVYMVSQISGQDTVYGLSIHAYSFSSFASVIVTPEEDGTTYHLQAYPGYKTDFYYDTPENELSKIKPNTGNYHFTATLESGEVIEIDDVLYTNVLYPPVIKESKYDTSNSKAVIEWGAVTGADLYVIKLYEGTELVFLSPAINPTYTKVEFTANSGSWVDGYEPTTGKTYKLVLSAFKYESEGDNYNVQASTGSKGNLLWGQ